MKLLQMYSKQQPKSKEKVRIYCRIQLRNGLGNNRIFNPEHRECCKCGEHIATDPMIEIWPDIKECNKSLENDEVKGCPFPEECIQQNRTNSPRKKPPMMGLSHTKQL
jgi:hypothetical protein